VGEKALETVMPLSEADISELVQVPGWCEPKHLAAACAMAEGYTKTDAAKFAEVTRQTIHDWLNHPKHGTEFKQLVRDITFKCGIASRETRLQEVKKLYRDSADQGVKFALRKHDSVDLLRLVGELSGDVGQAPDHPVIQFINQMFQVNVAGGAPPAVSDVVEGEVREIEEP
jgi:hypothetical protein